MVLASHNLLAKALSLSEVRLGFLGEGSVEIESIQPVEGLIITVVRKWGWMGERKCFRTAPEARRAKGPIVVVRACLVFDFAHRRQQANNSCIRKYVNAAEQFKFC